MGSDLVMWVRQAALNSCRPAPLLAAPRHNMLIRRLRQQRRDDLNEPARCFDCVTGKLARYVRAGAGLIVGNRFEIVGCDQGRHSAPGQTAGRPWSAAVARSAHRDAA